MQVDTCSGHHGTVLGDNTTVPTERRISTSITGTDRPQDSSGSVVLMNFKLKTKRVWVSLVNHATKAKHQQSIGKVLDGNALPTYYLVLTRLLCAMLRAWRVAVTVPGGTSSYCFHEGSWGFW